MSYNKSQISCNNIQIVSYLSISLDNDTLSDTFTMNPGDEFNKAICLQTWTGNKFWE